MDSHRQHKFINSNEERSKTLYCNIREVQDVTHHGSLYVQNKAAISQNCNKQCGCSAGLSEGLNCKDCTVEKNWKTSSQRNIDFKTIDVGKHSGKNSLYIHPDIGSAPYWKENISSFSEENSITNKSILPQSPQMDRRSCNQMYLSDPTEFKSIQSHQFQQPSKIGPSQSIGYCKRRACDDKCSFKLESRTIKNSHIIPGSSQNLLNCDVDSNDDLMETLKSSTTDRRMFNSPSKPIVINNEQHLSPSFVRKCPQLCSLEEQGNSYSNLYIPTPQFSSEKFASILPEKSIEYLARPNVNADIRLRDEVSKLCENSIQKMSAPPMVYSSQNKCIPIIKDHHRPYMQQHKQPIQHTSYQRFSTASEKSVHYMTSHSVPKEHPQMEVQSNPRSSVYGQYHYPGSSSSASFNMVEGKVELPTSLSEYDKKKEVPFEILGTAPSNRNGLYMNPYNTSHPAMACCKEATPPRSVMSNCQRESLYDYHNYEKPLENVNVSRNPSSSNQYNILTSGASTIRNLRDQAYPYNSGHSKYNNKSIYNVTQSSVVRSPLKSQPSPLSKTSQVRERAHHFQYSPQYLQQYQTYPQDEERQPVSVNNNSVSLGCNDVFEAPSQTSHNINYNTILPPQTVVVTTPGVVTEGGNIISGVVQASHPKKSQIPKPNYRELINQVHAMRSATSEEELNMQIIKKTLNVNTRQNNSTTDTSNIQATSKPYLQNWTSAGNTSGNRSFDFSDPDSVNRRINYDFNKPRVSSNSIRTENLNLNNVPLVYNVNEKTTSSPLDLSMRTIKTKADSTDYKYQQVALRTSQSPGTKFPYTLPRVDFTPNFSLHAKDTTSGIIKRKSIGDDKHTSPVKPKSEPVTLYANSEYSGMKFSLHENSPSSDICTKESKEIIVPYETPLSYTKPTDLQSPLETLIIKATPIKSPSLHSVETHQIRPSVLETNPYALCKALGKDATSLTHTSLPTISQLPPDTSVMPLKKPTVVETPTKIEEDIYITPLKKDPICHGIVCDTQNEEVTTIKKSLASEIDLNVFGRKRHLHEYNRYFLKQRKLMDPLQDLNGIAPVAIPVVEINETIADVGTVITPEKSTIDLISDKAVLCKKEQIYQSDEKFAQNVPSVNTDKKHLIAARIRTKAELKGFTFSPPPLNDSTCAPKVSIHIKEEPELHNQTIKQSISEHKDYTPEDLLDFGWSKTCNNFVEQLLSNSKKCVQKSKPKFVKTEKVPGDEELQTNVATTFNNNVLGEELFTSVHNPSFSDVTTGTVEEQHVDTDKITSIPNDLWLLQKNPSKIGREKHRIQQERRFAARLQEGSSSETDNELDRRKSDRLKKPFKKTKSRCNARAIKNHFSDCGSDSSGSDSCNLVNDQPIKHSNKLIESTSNITSFNIKANVSKIMEESKYIKQECKNKIAGEFEKDVVFTPSISKAIKCPEIELNTIQIPKKIKDRTKPFEKPCRKKGAQIDINRNPEKKVNSQKNNLKTCQYTLTRSKRKRELEMQLANSKVLRNDKIIRNSTTTTKIKRKYVRKFNNSHNQKNSSKDSFNTDIHNHLIMSTRLRSRKEKFAVSDRKKQATKKKCDIAKKTTSLTNCSDRQSDILMEVYRYKRSLKIPPSLISIKQPTNNKIESSLLHIDMENENEIVSESKNFNLKAVGSLQSAEKYSSSSQTFKPQHQHRSIIDLLHSRVIKATTYTKAKFTKMNPKNDVLTKNNEKVINTLQDTTSKAGEFPSLKHDDESGDDRKKRHFSIFDTKVLQTKTRTESKLLQKKEIIREIFVGDERPASAPPEFTPTAEGELKMTYEQKYEQFLQQMNETNLSNFNKKSPILIAGSINYHDSYQNYSDVIIKQEEDTESASAIDFDEKADENPPDNASTASTGPLPTNLRRRRTGKYFRRKGSSGFDYIRKKKKPSSVYITGTQQLDNKSEADYETKKKTEDDVSREIQKWVLNKGVGQSTMHKAARLGYIDVVVYCLDRLCMNPDQKDNAGYTPLHEACTNGWLGIAKILLQYGAKHSEAAHSGIRPLHEASENDHEEIVRLLLSFGADPLLATYSGQTPLMLASSVTVRDVIKNYLKDVQYVGPDRKSWRFEGPWKMYDNSECGYDIFNGVPNNICDMSRALNRSFGLKMATSRNQCNQYDMTSSKTALDNCTELYDNISHLNCVRSYVDGSSDVILSSNSDSESGTFEFEEADYLLPPLYLLEDEGTEKWVLLSDLCNLLKVKSKDTLLNKIYSSSSISSTHKELMRELKMSDFLEKATCLQLLCAGEKINICASKVVLIKYDDNVRNLLGVKTILMKF